LTTNDYTGEAPIDDKANQEFQRKRDQFYRDLIHEFANAITAVMGYSELALHEMDRSHPARGWLEKIKNHTRQLAFLVRKLTALSSGAKRVGNDER